MASRYAVNLKKKKKEASSSSSSGTLDVEALLKLSEEAGYTPPKPKGPSLLNRAFGILSSGETGNAVYQAMFENKNPLETYAGDIGKGVTLQGMPAEKKTYSDVLAKMGMPEGKILGPISARGALGLAGDILLDPTTYIGGAIAKGIGKAGKAVGKTGFKLAEKLPVAGKYVTKAGEAAVATKNAIEDVFVPFAKIKRMGPEGEKLADEFLKTTKSIRGDVLYNTESLFKLKRDLLEKGITGADITKIIESGTIDVETDAGKVAQYVSDMFKNFASEEGRRGLLKTNIDDYVAHIWTDEWREFVGKNGNILSAGMPRPLLAKLKSAKPRTILKTVDEINAKTMTDYGVKMFEDDVFRIAAARGIDHFRAVKVYDLLKYVKKNFGVSTKLLPDAREFAMIDGMKYVPFKPEGGLRMFKTVNEPSKEILKQLQFQEGRGFERSMAEMGELLNMADQYGIPVTKNNRLRTALGRIINRQMYPNSEIQLRAFNPETLAHEEGHLFDWLFGKQIEDISPALQKMKGMEVEMRWVSQNLPEKVGGKVYRNKPTEQFAEAMSQFITNRPSAEQMMPTFTAYMDKLIKKDPETFHRFTNLKAYFEAAKGKFPSPAKFNLRGWNMPQITSNVKKGVEATFPSKTGLGVTTKVPEYLLPEPIAQHLKETYSMLTNDESIHQFLRSYDKVLGFWKGSVTGLFPAFHSRNFMGGMWNNHLAGLKDLTLYAKANKIAKEGTEGTLTLGGKAYSYEELRLLMRENAVLGQTGMMDVAKTINEILNPPKGLAKIKNLPQMAMTEVENTLRGSLFLDGLGKGMTPYDAAKRVMKFHFDYAPEGLTSFERSVMKRLIPFYTWTRNNIPLQLTQMMKQPAKYATAGKTLRALSGGTSEERKQAENLPSYMKEVPPIRVGGTAEKPEYLYGFGMPFEDINRISLNDLISQMSPVLKTPLEMKTGYNFYSDQPTRATTTSPEFVGKLPDIIKKFVGYHEAKNKEGNTVRTVDPVKWAIVSSPISRFVTTAGKISDSKLSALSKAMYVALGTKARSVDMADEEYFRMKDRTDQLMKFLEARGLLKEFSTYYKPKEY